MKYLFRIDDLDYRFSWFDYLKFLTLSINLSLIELVANDSTLNYDGNDPFQIVDDVSFQNINLKNCVATYPVTPLDVAERPTICLVNFLLVGKQVVLEYPKPSKLAGEL